VRTRENGVDRTKLADAALLRKYNPDWEDELRVPAANPGGGEWTSGGGGDGFQIASAGDLKCHGFSGVCQSGGTYGTEAMYRIFGRNVCRDCAVKVWALKTSPEPNSREFWNDISLGDDKERRS
jgi:hypothetical protein